MSVLSYLEKVASTLVLSSDEKQSIAKSISTLQSRLSLFDVNNEIKTSYIFGSYDRETILPHCYDEESDIDYMIVFKDPFKVNHESCLRWLKKFAKEKYSTSEVHRDYPTIALELNHIKFELVPSVEMGSSVNLQIPAPKTLYLNWIHTRPFELAKQSHDANQRMKYKFKPLVRILKLWNVNNGRVYSSYQLERHLAQQVIFGDNLEEYLYYAVKWLPTNNITTSDEGKIKSLKQQVEMAKNYHDLKAEEAAEAIMKRLFPV